MQDFLNTTRRSIAWMKQTHDAGHLDMKPPFQRNPVWTDAQKSYLIDTILRGFPIPEIYVQERVDAEGQEWHTIVDGQQRIRACLSYIEGGFALDPEVVGDWPDATFEDLTPDERKKIFGYSFIVRQLPEASDDQLRAIFQRLNRNVVALNKQELRHATYWGPFIKSMEAISDGEHWSQIGVFTPNDVRRMLDIEYVSELAVAHIHGIPNKKASLDKWYAAYEIEFPDRERIEHLFQVVIGELLQILPSIASTRWRKKSDFYTLFLVFAAHSQALPLPKSGRAKATKRLLGFAAEVDSLIRTGSGAADEVVRYTDAVERAASDLANRTERHDVLEGLLKGIWRG